MKTVHSGGTNPQRTAATFFASLSGAMALAAFLSWITGRWEWLSLETGGVPPAPVTAILQILLVAILLADIFGSGSAASRRFRRVAAVLITVSGLAALLRPFFGWFSPLEQWIAGTTQTIDNVPVGQMSPLTGLVFLFAGSANWAKTFRFLNKRWPRRIKFGSSGLVFWISAVVILSYVAGSPLFSDRPIIPMALWTAIIFIFLSVAMALGHEPAESPAASVTSGDKKPLTHKPLLILMSFLVVFAVIAGGFIYFRVEESRIRQAKSEELAAIGKLKINQILRWRKERLADIARLASAAPFRQIVEEWLHEPDNAILKENIAQRLMLEVQTKIYFQGFLVDADAHVLLSFPETVKWEHGNFRDIAKKTWNQSGPVMSELYRDSSGSVHLDTVMVLRGISGQPLALAVLTSDAREYLFPTIQTWPVPSRSAETLLIQRDGEDALYLNDLRYRKNTALTLRLPLTETQVPAVQAILGKTGPTIGSDYRGVKVFADLRPVPGTSWYLVTKVDAAEILTEVRLRAVIILTIIFMLIAILFGLIVLLYQIRLMKERKAAAENLKFNKQKLDLALKSARMGVWQFNMVENKRTFDHQTYFLLGIDPATFGGTAKEFYARVHSEDREKIKEALARTIDGRAIYQPEYRVVWPDGSIHYITGRGEVTRDDQGKPLTIDGLIWDITERKRAEKMAYQAQERYRELVEGTDDLITVVDKEGRFVFVNHSAENFFGIKPEDCIGRLAFDFIHPDDKERTKIAFEGWVRGKEKRVIFQNRQVHKSGQVFEILWNINLYFDASGEVEQIVNFARDISEIKRAEEEIKKLNLELEERVSQRTAELSVAVKELEAFGYSIAHDLKAPLRVMSGFANILSEDYAPKLDGNAKRVIGVISDNARSMGTMIDDLLELTRMGRQRMSVADIDMMATVQSVWPLLEKKFSSGRAIELSVKPLPSTRADPVLIKQIFINLIANALKFTRLKEKAVIEIGGYDKDGEHVYYVKDNGAGFDMKYKDKLFGIFQRLHSQEQFEGTGIGLAIVKAAVLRHGGRVWAQGETGQGATFYFTLSQEGKLPAQSP